MTVGMSKARITEEMSQREPKVRVAGSAVKNKPTTNTAMKAGQRGSGLVRCTSSSMNNQPIPCQDHRSNNIPISNRSSTGKAYRLRDTVGEMTKMRRKEEFLPMYLVQNHPHRRSAFSSRARARNS